MVIRISNSWSDGTKDFVHYHILKKCSSVSNASAVFRFRKKHSLTNKIQYIKYCVVTKYLTSLMRFKGKFHSLSHTQPYFTLLKAVRENMWVIVFDDNKTLHKQEINY